MTTNVKITYSTELMQNYQQAEVISPQQEFQALQTSDGHSLLFSIGTDDVFYLIEQQTGHSTGWERIDLSSKLSSVHNNAKIIAKTFAVAQNVATNEIDIALVITVDCKDYLYLSLNNDDSGASITSESIVWTIMPYDDPDHPGITLDIVDVYIAEGRWEEEEYVVVDISQSTFSQPTNFLERYHIDPSKATGQIWNVLTMGGDLEPGVQSCLGRKAGDRVDGIYALGSISGTVELLYVPLYNPWDRQAPPTITRLQMPQGASAIDVADAGQGATDLFVAADKALYYFASDKQQDSASGTLVLKHDVFQDVTRLFAHATDSKFIVWGLNRDNEIFYTTCDKSRVTDSSAWSYPLALLKGVEQVTTYVNRVDDGNVFFAHTGVGDIKMAVQTPSTTLWTYHNITLPLPEIANNSTLSFSSYTTRIQVNDANNTPQSKAKLNVSAVSRCQVLINNVYYILDTDPIEIETDATGGITIVEKITGLAGTCLKFSEVGGSNVVSINPMEKPQNKLAELESPQALSDAQIQYSNVKKEPKPLIASTASDADKQAVVQFLAQLKSAAASVPADGSVAAPVVRSSTSLSAVPANRVVKVSGFIGEAGVVAGESTALPQSTFVAKNGLIDFSHAIEIAPGDIFSFIEHAFEGVVHVFVVVAEDAWHMIVHLGEKVFRFVLNCVSTIAKAIEVVFRAIKTAIEDLIDFLKFLFDWDNYIRTKDVIRQILNLNLILATQDMSSLEDELNNLISEAKNMIDDWANIKHDTWTGVENHDQNMSYINAITDISSAFSAPAMFFYDHVINNIVQISMPDMSAIPQPDQSESLIGEIVTALENEGSIFADAVNRIKTELVDNNAATTLSLGDILKKLVAIIMDAILNMAENLLDTLINIFIILAKWSIEAMNAKISFPIISDILKDFGIDFSFSFLDLVCMVGAIPATIVYHLAKGSAPFSADDGYSSKIINARTPQELQAAFGGSNAQVNNPAVEDVAVSFIPITLPTVAQETIFIVGHLVAGIATLASAVFVVAEAESEESSGDISTAVGICGVVSGGGKGIATLFAQPYPIENQIMSKMSTIVAFLSLASKVIFKVAPKCIVKDKDITEPDKIKSLEQKAGVAGAGFDAFFGLLALIPTCYHFYELSKDAASINRSLAIIDETSNVCDDLRKVCAFIVKVVDEPDSKAVITVLMFALIFINGLLQISESMISESSTDAAA